MSHGWARQAMDILGSDAMQLRAPFFLAAMIGAMGWSIAWLVNFFEKYCDLAVLKYHRGMVGPSLPIFDFGVSISSRPPS